MDHRECVMKVRVRNMEGRSGPVANQFIISTDEGVYFQSYRTTIAFEPNSGKERGRRKNRDFLSRLDPSK